MWIKFSACFSYVLCSMLSIIIFFVFMQIEWLLVFTVFCQCHTSYFSLSLSFSTHTYACMHTYMYTLHKQTYTCVQIFGPYSWAAFLSKGLPIPEWMQLPLPFFGRSALLISSDILASPLCSLFWICRALKYLLFLMQHNELVIMFWKSNMDQSNFLTKIYFYLMWGKKLTLFLL